MFVLFKVKNQQSQSLEQTVTDVRAVSSCANDRIMNKLAFADKRAILTGGASEEGRAIGHQLFTLGLTVSTCKHLFKQTIIT